VDLGQGSCVAGSRMVFVECDLEKQNDLVSWRPSTYGPLDTTMTVRVYHKGSGLISF
jgi:hypothetical protein